MWREDGSAVAARRAWWRQASRYSVSLPADLARENWLHKGMTLSGWALRTFSTREEEHMIIFWKSLFRPCLDPCSPLWSPIPSDFQEIDLLKETQRVFNRQIKGLEGLDYAEPLKKLKKPMYSIQRRNERFKIIYIYKIKEKLAPNISYRNGLSLICI